jgi:hypothetical protein
LDYLGISHLAKHAGQEGSAYGLHYQGAAGSSFAAGLVGFLAISFVMSDFSSSAIHGKIARGLVAVALIGSIYLTGTKTYLATALFSTAIFVIPANRRIPLVVCGAGVSILFLYVTFNYAAGDTDNQLRSMLILDGLDGAKRHPVLGVGPSYIDTTSLHATYQQLHSAGVVESGLFQFAIFYGLPSAICLVTSSCLSQAAIRPKQSFSSVVLCMITSILAFNPAIGSFLGSITFYTALIYCQRDELREAGSG